MEGENVNLHRTKVKDLQNYFENWSQNESPTQDDNPTKLQRHTHHLKDKLPKQE